VLEQPEGLLLVVGDDQQQAGYIVEALAVADIPIVVGVGDEDVVQALLLRIEVNIVGEGTR